MTAYAFCVPIDSWTWAVMGALTFYGVGRLVVDLVGMVPAVRRIVRRYEENAL